MIAETSLKHLSLQYKPKGNALPNEDLMNQSSLVIYIDTSFDQNIMIEKIMNKYGFTGYEQLYYSGINMK